VEIGAASSKSEAKRLVSQGGVYIDGERIEDIRFTVEPDGEMVLRVGKRKFYRILGGETKKL
jgi:tyrosyl-tRNA synthetase